MVMSEVNREPHHLGLCKEVEKPLEDLEQKCDMI